MSKSVKIGLLKWIFYVKNHPNLSNLFSMKNKSLGAHFLLKWFFSNFNFKTPLLLKLCPIFDEAQLHGFARKKCFVLWLSVPHGTSDFVYPKMILHNRGRGISHGLLDIWSTCLGIQWHSKDKSFLKSYVNLCRP